MRTLRVWIGGARGFHPPYGGWGVSLPFAAVEDKPPARTQGRRPPRITRPPSGLVMRAMRLGGLYLSAKPGQKRGYE
ncbi:hypothetical protein SAMN04487859_10772 [Roseovarius lutimaris]|uniref:Uncharacterized protein n=1 Tax=Roseovarius lutimaris TaxID=1005928 RepID=A0A1I5B5F9_9RHOB|nr:hypothetical protein SAMN04487859_10772 [Roseovarius lutimaris]